MTGESWVEKHRPDSFNKIQGNNKALKEIKSWAEGWTEGDTPKLLIGPPGVGKTTTAYVVADTMGYPLNQINASSARRKEEIEDMARQMRIKPVDAPHQLVLLDEVDSWHSSTNKRPLYDALSNPSNPVILTANEEWNVPNGIKKRCDKHKFKLGKRSRKAYLKKVAKKEGLELDDQDLAKLASAPDLRSAINDLQNWSGEDGPPGMDKRSWEEDNFKSIKKLLGGASEWGQSFNPPEKVFWADENLTEEWRGLEAGVAYDALSMADIWLSRAETGDYRYWKYASALCDMLPETRLSEPYQGYIDASFPGWWKSSAKTADESSNEGELYRAIKQDRGFQFASSYSEFRTELLPILQDLPEEEKRELVLNYNLNKEACTALGLSKSETDEWAGEGSVGKGEGYQESAADW